MNDNTIEIRDDEINVEEIMQKIRENIERRRAAGELPPDPDPLTSSLFSVKPHVESGDSTQRDLLLINTSWDIHNNGYFISTHHPFLGKFLVKGRQIVHGEVRRYIDPIISRQTEFNAGTVRLLNHASQKYSEFENALNQYRRDSDQNIRESLDTFKKEIHSTIDTRFNELDGKINIIAEEQNSKINSRFQEQDDKNETLFRESFSQLDADIHARASLAHVLEERLQNGLFQKGGEAEERIPDSDTNYFLFEERFRGSRKDIAQRQLVFLPYFEKCSRVLDIGCGRGEFLETLRDHNINALGVDVDADMVAYCRSRQLSVEQSDAVTYLEKLDDKSLDGIFIDQVIEHLEPQYLVRLFGLCQQKLKYGYYLIAETVNPLSFVSFVNFYIDMTHKRPVHPETLQFLLSAAGFRETEKKFFSPVSDEVRLKKITSMREVDESSRKNIETYNDNVDRLNAILFGAQDYAVIGKK
jgi:O-antigen chain-terminating methyltransferase